MGETIRILSAGSLRHAMPEIIEIFSRSTGIGVSIVLGPAGLLRERIEEGEPFDIFASAIMTHPRRLVEIGLADDVICFARNRLCMLARASLGVTSDNFLRVLVDPAVRIGTSTPGDDAAGDYAFEMFDRIEEKHHGVGDGLKSRAQQLVGGRHSPPGRTAAGLIAEDVVDVFLGYASNTRLHQSDPALSVVGVPPAYSPNVEYGLALRKGSRDESCKFREFLMSNPAQEVLKRNGFLVGGSV